MFMDEKNTPKSSGLDDLKKEWLLLQAETDRYEKCALGIKLFTVAIVALLLISQPLLMFSWAVLIVLVVGLLWLTEGVWKTYQARIDQRLIQLEQALEQEQTAQAFYYQLQFERSREGRSLVSEYIKNSLRPTVAYLYVSLMAITLVYWLISPRIF
jgi:cell division protein FtsL